MEIPVYDVIIDDSVVGLDGISFVSAPAIEKNFIYQSDATRPVQLFQFDQYKHIVEGPLLIPDQLIIRVDEDNNPYYIKWTEESIYNALLSWYKGKHSKVTIEHGQNDIKNDNISLLSLYIDDSGILQAKYKVTDETLWSKIISNEVVGFSIEAQVNLRRN